MSGTPRVLYTILVALFAPVALLGLMWKARREPLYLRRLGDRFGRDSDQGKSTARHDPAGPTLWVHAASVGEVQAAAPLVQRLGERYPDHRLLVTTVSASGLALARDRFGDSVVSCFLPYDLPGACRRFLRRYRPAMGIVMETELWPNLFHRCRLESVPLIIASARLSDAAFRRYRKWARLWSDTLGEGVRVAAQSGPDAERFVALGAREGSTEVLGNLKFDGIPSGHEIDEGRRFRREYCADRPVWLAASTHAGEDEAVLRAHRLLLERIPGTMLLLAPRYPDRADALAEWMRRARLGIARRSREQAPGSDTEVYLIDTLGDLAAFYTAADVAFVGGSLVPKGGHNVLEPMLAGLPVVTGSRHGNPGGMIGSLAEAGSLELVDDERRLAESLERLLRDPGAVARRRAAADRVIEANRGALDGVLAMVAAALEKKGTVSWDPDPDVARPGGPGGHRG